MRIHQIKILDRNDFIVREYTNKENIYYDIEIYKSNGEGFEFKLVEIDSTIGNIEYIIELDIKKIPDIDIKVNDCNCFGSSDSVLYSMIIKFTHLIYKKTLEQEKEMIKKAFNKTIKDNSEFLKFVDKLAEMKGFKY